MFTLLVLPWPWGFPGGLLGLCLREVQLVGQEGLHELYSERLGPGCWACSPWLPCVPGRLVREDCTKWCLKRDTMLRKLFVSSLAFLVDGMEKSRLLHCNKNPTEVQAPLNKVTSPTCVGVPSKGTLAVLYPGVLSAFHPWLLGVVCRSNIWAQIWKNVSCGTQSKPPSLVHPSYLAPSLGANATPSSLQHGLCKVWRAGKYFWLVLYLSFLGFLGSSRRLSHRSWSLFWSRVGIGWPKRAVNAMGPQALERVLKRLIFLGAPKDP